MAVRIRLSRYGRIHRPYFRIVAIDKRCHREGVANEIVGSYDPLLPEKNIDIKMDRVEAWVKEGAQVSTALVNLLKHHGYQLPTTTAKPAAEAKPAKPRAKKDGKKWVAPSRRAVKAHEAKLKAVRKTETAAAAAASAAAKAAEKPAEPAAEAPTT